MAEGGEAPYDSLNPLYVLNRAILWVGFDATLGDDEAKQHAPRDPEKTLLGIEFDAIRPEFRKGLLKIGNKVVSRLDLTMMSSM